MGSPCPDSATPAASRTARRRTGTRPAPSPIPRTPAEGPRVARTSSWLLQGAAQPRERVQHLGVRKVGVAAAGIRQDEDARAFEPLLLHAERDRLALAPAEDRPEQRDADEGYHLGLQAADLSAQRFRARDLVLRAH